MKTIREVVEKHGKQARAIRCWVVLGRKDACLLGGVVLEALLDGSIDILGSRGRFTKKTERVVSGVAHELPWTILGTGYDFNDEILMERPLHGNVMVAKKPLPPRVVAPMVEHLTSALESQYADWSNFVEKVKVFKHQMKDI